MLIVLAVFCALLESAFTLLEVALGAASRARLRGLLEEAQVSAAPENNGGASTRAAARTTRALRVLDNAPRTTLLFITVTSLSLWTATASLTWQSLLEDWPDWTLPLALTGVLFVAEVLPVLIAAPRAEAIALWGAGFIEAALRVLAPLLWLSGGVGRGLARILGARENASTQVTADELRTALAAAEEEGAIESGERALLEGAMDFRSKVAREVMTTRREIAAVSADASLAEVLRTATEAGHSRLPIYEVSLDKIIGIASTKDLLPFLRADRSPSVTAREIARPPFFVPETKRIAPLLDELRHQRSLMAVVVDDDGATVGLVTLENLLEEIVGDIQDEYDAEEPSMQVLADAAGEEAIAYDGGVSVRDAERFWEKSFGRSAVLHDADGEIADDTISLAALALHCFDGVPHAGQHTVIGKVRGANDEELASLSLEVLRMDGPRIEAVKIQVVANPQPISENQ
jgi:putative hemolysin